MLRLYPGHNCERLLFMLGATSEELLGFDARVCTPFQLERLRASPHRYLLRTDVTLVCSVDELVWPSVFQPRTSLETTGLEDEGLTLPHWIGPNFPLWAKLRELENHVSAVLHAIPVWKVAITEVVCSENGNQPEERTFWPFLKTTEPPSVQEDWVFLGYDVADRSLLSGLSACAYSDEELPRFTAMFAGNLNEYHLFTSLEVAMRFKELSNQRVKEHAPFYVYGLRRVP